LHGKQWKLHIPKFETCPKTTHEDACSMNSLQQQKNGTTKTGCKMSPGTTATAAGGSARFA